MLFYFDFCSWMGNIHELRGHSDVSGWRSLTHSIPINLFIKSGLNNFLLPPLLSIVFVQECSVVFQRGGSRKEYIFTRQLNCLGTSLSKSSKNEVGHFSFMWFSFVIMLFFYLSALLTRRWKLVEVFMTVVKYRLQQHGRRGQRIDTRHP